MQNGCKGVNWPHLSQDRDQWQVVVKAVMNLRVSKRWVIFWLHEWLLASQERLIHGVS